MPVGHVIISAQWWLIESQSNFVFNLSILSVSTTRIQWDLKALRYKTMNRKWFSYKLSTSVAFNDIDCPKLSSLAWVWPNNVFILKLLKSRVRSSNSSWQNVWNRPTTLNSFISQCSSCSVGLEYWSMKARTAHNMLITMCVSGHYTSKALAKHNLNYFFRWYAPLVSTLPCHQTFDCTM